MLIPSIDLLGGRIVQLVQGERQALAFDDFEYWIDRFCHYPLVQLIDLDAAMRTGSNRHLIARFTDRLRCQVGGGIHTVNQALTLIDSGAHRVILGSKLFHSAGNALATVSISEYIDLDFAASACRALGTDRLVFGIDTKNGLIAVKGWRDSVAITPHQAIPILDPYCGAFLYTHVDTEGTMSGFPIHIARELRSLTERQLIVAGGIREREEIDLLDSIGVDAVSGMAIYTGAIRT